MKNKMTLISLISVFALPPLLAYLLYFTNTIPGSRSNNGHLINPIVDLSEFPMQSDLQLNKLIDDFKGKWTMFMLINKPCQSFCQNNIYLMRQVFRVLGKNNSNVKRVVLIANVSNLPESENIFINYPKMSVVKANQSSIDHFINPFKNIVSDIYQRIFIIDPYGRVILYYPVNFKPDDLLSDLKRLVVINNNSKQFNRGFF
jgi:cytochrome oxidase Cu insertion factor (SCO1/SenC/PrrC family)